MPEVQMGMDGSPEAAASYAEETARVEAARAELYDEATGSSEGELILGKYRSVDDLAHAYQSLQSEYSRLRNGQGQTAPETPVDNGVDNAELAADESQPQRSSITPEQAEIGRAHV